MPAKPVREHAIRAGIETHRSQELDVLRLRDLRPLDPRWTDVEIELPVDPADAGIPNAEGIAERRHCLGCRLTRGRRAQQAHRVFGVRHPGRFGGNRTGHLEGVVDQQARLEVGDDPRQVVEHRRHAHPPEHDGLRDRHPLRNRDLVQVRDGGQEPRACDGLVEARWMRLEPHAFDVGTERRIRGHDDVVTRVPERKCQRHHGMEMAVSDDTGDQDVHDLHPEDAEPRLRDRGVERGLDAHASGRGACRAGR